MKVTKKLRIYNMILYINMNTANCIKKEKIFKVLVIGAVGTGKTSFIRRYVSQKFFINYKATIGSELATKVIDWDENCKIRLQLWDIAGQERVISMTRVYYKEAVAAFVVFDVTRATTYEAVEKWKNDLDSKVFLPNGSPIPAVLLANKCDLVSEGLHSNTTQMNEFCAEKGFAGWFETSAKENIGLDEAATFLVHKILDNESTTPIELSGSHPPNNGVIRPVQEQHSEHTTEQRKSRRCCS
ncbi:ras-related Rab-38-like [Paramuricea clavata]|uniref:Ras-related protein Rab n=1 Tax=Paramuricea clavata TaxID=317549 RepID=A0A6S7HRA9_PARCT|nr:ras-related Rab-38-like [Paramuricea clavata]